MRREYILPISLGIGTGLLLLFFLFLLYKSLDGQNKHHQKTSKKKKSTTAPTPTIVPQNIPGFMLPTWRNVRVQEPLRKINENTDDPSSDEFEEILKPRTNSDIPLSTVITSSQSLSDIRVIPKMAEASPLKKKKIPSLSGSISLQDLNIYSPKSRLRQTPSCEVVVPNLKFALYYSVATSELNVTVISISNLTQLATIESPNLCVWVQVEFSRYHQEFRTKSSSCPDNPVFNETCVVSEFPVEHFSGSKISFRVIDNESSVVAEAVYVVLGLPPSFPRNETIELQHPGIVQSTQSSNNGEILIRLMYDPVDEVVVLGIVECRGLKSARRRYKLLDTYVKVQVIFCNETVQKLKSKLVQKTNNPKFETTFNLSGFFSRGKMNQVLLKLTVFAKSVTKYGLGYIILGTGRQDNDMTASGYQHWETIVDKPQLDIAQWHALKPLRSVTP